MERKGVKKTKNLYESGLRRSIIVRLILSMCELKLD